MTYRDALHYGLVEGDKTYNKKYIPQNIDIFDQPLLMAGGKRKGQYYIEIPNPESKRHSYRLYIKSVG